MVKRIGSAAVEIATGGTDSVTRLHCGTMKSPLGITVRSESRQHETEQAVSAVVW
jgi:hypothetical protein